MGTAHLILAAAARKRQLESQRRMRESERRRRESAERRRKNLEEEKKKDNKGKNGSSHYSYSTQNYYSFEEHLIPIIQANPNYFKYIIDLYNEGVRLDEEDKTKIKTELDEVAPQILEEERKLAEIRKKLEESGISIGTKYSIDGMRIDQKGQLPFTHRVGSHRYNFTNFPIQFNGIRIKKEDLENNGAYYEGAYAKERNEYPNAEEELEKSKKKLARQKRIWKFPFMDTDSRYETIKDLEAEVEKGEFALRRINEKKQELDTFKSFTPEQRELIKEYLDQIYRVKALSDPAGERVKTYEEIGLYYRRTDAIRDKWGRANKRLIESGKVSEETIKSFYDMIEEELSRVQVIYSDGKSLESVHDPSLSSEGPLFWIIKVRSVEYTREKRDKLLEEQKKLDETIALTEKRDDMLEQKQGDSGKEEEGRE